MKVTIRPFIVPCLAVAMAASLPTFNRCFADGFVFRAPFKPGARSAVDEPRIWFEGGNRDVSLDNEKVRSFSLTKLQANSMESSEEDVQRDTATSSLIRKLVFGSILVGDTIWSYTLAPGHDGTIFPQSDIQLITNVVNPSFMENPPAGYALYALLAFNAFLFAPFCWGGILYKERDNFATWPFILASFPMAGISIYPYLAVRNPSLAEDEPTYANRLADNSLGRGLILSLFLVTVATFALTPTGSLSDEWNGFVGILTSSQYASTTVSDVLLLSVSLVDPLSLDAKKRGYLAPDASPLEAVAKLVPFLVPVYGILFWILARPALLEDYA